MNEAMKKAARLFREGRYAESAAIHARLVETLPAEAAFCATQVAAAKLRLKDYVAAISWYRRAEALGYPPERIAARIRDVEEAQAAALREASQGVLERSPGGSWMSRYTAVPPAPTGPARSPDERMAAHLDRVFGREGLVLRKSYEDIERIDLHQIPASDERPYQILITDGMSARPMNVAPTVKDADVWRHIELCMLLPADWPMTTEAWRDERFYWPVRLLEFLAWMPRLLNTFLGCGHSVTHGEPPEPYAPGVPFTGALVIPPYGMREDFFTVPGDPPIHIFQILPVTSEEMDLKLEIGLDEALAEIQALCPDLYGPVDPARPTWPP